MENKLLTYLKLFKKLTQFVFLFYYKDLELQGRNSLTRRILYKTKVMIESQGTLAAATYIKLCRLAITKTLSGEELDRPFGISLAKDNLPSLLPASVRRRIVEGDKLLISWILTVLQVSKLIKGDPSKLNIETIIEPGSYKDTIPQYQIALVMNKMGLSRGSTELAFSGFSWISTAGPNGLSILRSMEDLLNLPQTLLDSCITLNGGTDSYFAKCVLSLKAFLEHCHAMYQNIFSIKPAKSKKLRKIAIKADKEGKSRPFAIFEYISQMALTSLHDRVYEILKGIPQDSTFDQNAGFRDILYGGFSFYASFDLKAATDRFPIAFQKRVVDHLLGDQEKSDAWEHIMTAYPFSLPNGKEIRFATGQPLGAKSSWGVFSLSHHIVVHISALRIGMILDNLPYRLLGDDIVIMDEPLAESYLKVMTELGVEISKTKTHRGKTLFEFAKRFAYRGSEITQFPITGLIESIKVYSLFVQVLESARERGFLPLFVQSSSPTFWDEVVKLQVSPKKKRLYTYLLEKYKKFALLPTSSKPFMTRVQDLITLAQASYKISDVSLIDKALLNAIIEVREREIDKLVSKKTKYNLTVQSLLGSIMFFIPYDRISVLHREFLPVVSALDKSTALKADVLVNVRTIQSGLTASETLETDPIRPVPSLKGLQPIRPNEVIARSRSSLLKPLLNQLRIIAAEETVKQETNNSTQIES